MDDHFHIFSGLYENTTTLAELLKNDFEFHPTKPRENTEMCSRQGSGTDVTPRTKEKERSLDCSSR